MAQSQELYWLQEVITITELEGSRKLMHVLLNFVKLRRKIIQNTGRKYTKITKKEKGKKASLFKSK